MKKVFTLILVLFCKHAFAQDSLKNYTNMRIHNTSSGMGVLGGWGALNLASGAIGWSNSTTNESRYFFEMNTIWGAANFGTALVTYAGLQRERKKHYTAAEELQRQEKLKKIFLVNGAFDIVYLGAGAYLKIAGDSRNSPIMKGFGESVLIQGAFLLIFDGAMYHAEKGNESKLRTFLEKHPITFDGKRVGIVFNM
jgi:hypothetical protein